MPAVVAILPSISVFIPLHQLLLPNSLDSTWDLPTKEMGALSISFLWVKYQLRVWPVSMAMNHKAKLGSGDISSGFKF